MILTRRILTIIFPMLVLADLEFFVLYPQKLYTFLAILIILPMLPFFKMVKIREQTGEFFGFLLAPLFFLLAVFLALLFEENLIMRQIIVVLAVFAYAVFLEHLFRFLYLPQKYQPYALENISGALNIITIFLATTGFFNFIHLFSFSHLLIGTAIAVIVLLLSIQTLWVNKIKVGENWRSIVAVTVLIFEILYATYYLPVSPLVVAVLVATFYYCLINFIRHNLLKTLDRAVLKRYFVVGLIVIIATLLSARWA